MADRFYAPEPLAPGEFILEGPEAHHLAHVRRFDAGDEVVLFNGDGRQYPARVTSIGKREVRLEVIRVEAPSRELGFALHVAAALPKGDRGDFLIEKLTELGVTDFTPLAAARSVVRAGETKAEKLRRAVIEASKQCGRNVLMRVHAPARVEDWLGLESLPPTRWIAHAGGTTPAVAQAIQGGVAVAVGPEGGFTEEEVAAAVRSGFERVGLGPRVLRVETAALAVVAWVGLGSPAGPSSPAG